MAEDAGTSASNEEIIYVECSGVFHERWNDGTDKNCKILGIETEKPVMQCGHHLFSGEYKDINGTMVFFEVEDDQSVKYVCHTHKMLNMQRIFVTDDSSKVHSDDQSSQ